jgi:hypothetical protein
MTYKVLVDDNFHYMEEDERFTHGEFETLEAAMEACRNIVDKCLKDGYTPGMSAEELYKGYIAFGEDPWVSGGEGTPFSAWDYAKRRCAEICGGDLAKSQ